MASTILISVLPGFAAETEQWGTPVNGLRMSITSRNADDRQIEVRIENTTDTNLLVPFGSNLEALAVADRLKIVLTAPNPGAPEATYLEGFGSGYRHGNAIIAAPLRSGATLRRIIILKDYYMFGGSERLDYALDHAVAVRAELQESTSDAAVSQIVLPARTPARLGYEFYLRLLEFRKGVPCSIFEQRSDTLRCWIGGTIVSNTIRLEIGPKSFSGQ